MRLIDADELKNRKIYSIERHEYIVPVAYIDWADTIEFPCEVKQKINEENGEDKTD